MEGNNSTKLLRLGGYLLTHPHELFFYAANSPLAAKSPIDMELPWISLGAIKFLKKYLRDDMVIFEWGSGGSTLFFSKLVAKIVSFESHMNWHELVKTKLDRKNITNVDLKYLYGNFESKDKFIESDFFKSFPEEFFDLILVDYYEDQVQVRPECFYLSEKHVKEGGVIVLDDSWRYPEIRENNKARSFEIFKSIGPGRYGVTTTDVYFY